MVNFLDLFLDACIKVFRKASLSLMKEQVSRLARSAKNKKKVLTIQEWGVAVVTVFRLILAKRVKH